MRRVKNGSPLRRKNIRAIYIMDIEYWHDIHYRYQLELMAEQFKEPDLSRLRKQLAPLDERLRRLLGNFTVDGEHYFPLSGRSAGHYWFVRALPRCANWWYGHHEETLGSND